MQPDEFYEYPAIERDRDERLAEEAGEKLGGTEGGDDVDPSPGPAEDGAKP